jgi:hypothetical protein
LRKIAPPVYLPAHNVHGLHLFDRLEKGAANQAIEQGQFLLQCNDLRIGPIAADK